MRCFATWSFEHVFGVGVEEDVSHTLILSKSMDNTVW